jgi:acetoin utilization deacetylase AcuC-like enzyme
MSAGAPRQHEAGPSHDGRPRVLLLTDPAMERHAAPGHPERHERLAAVSAGVEAGTAAAGGELVVRSPRPASDDAILGIHDREYLETLDDFDRSGGGWIDADTYVTAGSMTAARLAAGGALDAALAVARGEATVAFAVVRPPGHHAAAARTGGFCLLNNVAIAAAALRREGLAQRIAVADWDVHHGDGTQQIFEEDPDLLYLSTHQRPLYPGTGSPADRGMGAGRGTKHNVSLAPGAGDDEFVSAWSAQLVPALREFAPAAILVSAGYDAHRDDPLAHLAVTQDGYRAVTRLIGQSAATLGLPGVALVLEGGYDLRALEASAAATVEGLLAGLAAGAGGARTEA